jgi:AmpE protein
LFLVNGITLLYAIGRGSWQKACDQWVELFNEVDPAVFQHKLKDSELSLSANETSEGKNDEDIEAVWHAARRRVLYNQLSGFYTVVFWFFITGAPLAFLYRLAQLSRKKLTKDEGVQPEVLSQADRLIWLLEWLPVRLMALLFCLVGHFATSFWVLRQIMRDTLTSSVEVLTRCADAALYVDKEEEGDISANEATEVSRQKRMERMTRKNLEKKTMEVMRRYCRELQVLLKRVEIAFLAVLAVATLF